VLIDKVKEKRKKRSNECPKKGKDAKKEMNNL
jgi:hypothetical protein